MIGSYARDIFIKQPLPIGPLPDWAIKRLVEETDFIKNFVPHQVKEVDGKKVISYGLSSFGYDIRVDNKYKIFSPATGVNTVIDAKDPDPKAMVDFEGDVCFIPPHSFVLAKSFEYFKIPKHMIVICIGKSTYARNGIILNVTPLEPGWPGFITLEISNTTPLPVKIYSREGIGQLIFLNSDSVPDVTYADRSGKYMYQNDITLGQV